MTLAETQSPPVARATVEGHIDGDVSGQVAMGDHIVQVGSMHGSVLNINTKRPIPRLRAGVARHPKPFPGLVGRDTEVSLALGSLAGGGPVEFHAGAGMGKSSLLRHLAHHPDAPTPERVVFCRGRRLPLLDVLQFLFDALYECDEDYVPGLPKVSRYLHDVEAFVVIDDHDLDGDDVGALLDIAPRCRFLLTAEECHLTHDGEDVALGGLGEEAGVELLEREVQRSLRTDEREQARRLCRAVEGHPLRLVQAGAAVRKGHASLAELAPPDPVPWAEALDDRLWASLSPEQRDILSLLSALRDAPVPVEHVEAITGRPDAARVLESLRELARTKAYSPRYTLTAPLSRVSEAEMNRWGVRAVKHFTAAVERHRRRPAGLFDSADAALASLEWAVSAGRTADVVGLGRAIAPVLSLARRWAASGRATHLVLNAARTLGDRGAEAWAHHELGARAICLGDAAVARLHLEQALRLRRSLGDSAGADVTRYHLDLLQGPPPPKKAGPDGPRPTGPRRPWRRVLGGVSLAVLAALVVLALVSRRGSPASRTWSFVAQGTSYSVKFEPDQMRFGRHDVGSASPARTITLTNVGDTALPVIASVGIGSGDRSDFTIAGQSCQGAALAPGSGCRVTVTFAPTATGERRATLDLGTAGTGTAVPLAGTGGVASSSGPGPSSTVDTTGPTTSTTTTLVDPPQPASVAVDPKSVNFGYASDALPESVEVTNTGTSPLTIDDVSITNGRNFLFVGGCVGRTLPPGGSCTAGVLYKPLDEGAVSDTLIVVTGDVRVAVALTGQTDQPPEVTSPEPTSTTTESPEP